MKKLLFTTLLCIASLATARASTEYVDDEQLRGLLQRHLERYSESSNKVSVATLRAQLSRTNTVLKTSKPATRERDWSEVYSRVKDSVFIIGEIYKCPKCKNWHQSTASGFVITADGALVTNFHVVNEGEGQVMGAMNMNGEFFPVVEVLAASKNEDVAVVRLGGEGKFQPLPLQPSKSVGSPVAVLSHPDRSFYSLTEGMISRYSTSKIRQHASARRHSLVITADYAKGSSGAPVFDVCGNVVGLASSTESVYYEEDHGEQKNLQQVFKYCVPAECVLDLITPR
jgi:serine protease Do